MSSFLDYYLNASEPATFSELYLPKKSAFQGTLYETLSAGFDIEKVKLHFLNPAHRLGIDEILEFTALRTLFLSRGKIKSFPAIFHGYSLYEVDGVFAGEGGAVVEERTQVVRMIFRPDFQEIASLTALSPGEVRALARVNLANRGSGGAFVSTQNPDVLKIPEEARKSVQTHLDKWSAYVELFIFGYIVHNLCARIRALRNSVDSWKPEDEIWVTTSHSAHVQRVTFDPIKNIGL